MTARPLTPERWPHLFTRAGFTAVAERRPGRPVVRLQLGRGRGR